MPRSWQLYLYAGVAAAIGYTLLPETDKVHAVAYAFVGLSCILAVLYSVRRHRPDQSSTWYAFAVGLVFWLVNTTIDRVTHDQPWTHVSAVLSLAGYPLIGHALIGLIRGRVGGQDRTTALDAGIVATGTALLFWTMVAGEIDLTWLQLLVGAGDITLLVLISLLVTTPGARTVSFRLLLAALALMCASDAAIMLGSGTFGDVTMILANAFVGAAVAHPTMRQLTVRVEQPPRFVRPRLALLTAAILLAPAVSLHQGATGRIADHWLPLGVGSIVLFALVSARMAGLVMRVEQQAERLSVLVHEDPLTGLANRRRWDERLRTAMSRSSATGDPLVVALLDLDRFKLYNDTHGHQAGDELLTGAAGAWLGGLRGDDLLARYGGEEFCVLMTGRTVDEARIVVERLQALTPHGQTFSAGVTRWDGRQSPAELLEHADTLLYQSKHAGRARVTADKSLAEAA
ncbi:diguanylate cyclase domain-containing protein [Actinoplanes sp. G11-F43]|uniref:GGDEF domain-containing protein n=1 Tax=Actinoplanes sp. G11-F43 TaxID=3424130 RepID=UPI003D351772